MRPRQLRLNWRSRADGVASRCNNVQMELTAVILAAGLGTRMKSRKAKVLHCAGGMTLIEHVVNASVKLTAPERIHVIVGHQAETVRQLLQARGVGFIDQREQKGTGHAL